MREIPDPTTHPSSYATTTNQSVCLLPIEEIKPHEHIDIVHALELCRAIREFGYFTTPALVDRRDLILLDGHHRHWVLANAIGAKFLPAILVDYDDPSVVSLSSWRDDVVVDQQLVRRAALSKRLLRPKTSRHTVHIDVGSLMIPLPRLMPEGHHRQGPVVP